MPDNKILQLHSKSNHIISLLNTFFLTLADEGKNVDSLNITFYNMFCDYYKIIYNLSSTYEFLGR